MDLNITLRRYWFDMIARREKLEEYREIKPYWIQRLCLHEFHNKTPEEIISLSENIPFFKGEPYTIFRKDFDMVSAQNGYGPHVPTLKFVPGKIRIGMAKREWIGPEYNGELVFIIPVLQIVSVNK